MQFSVGSSAVTEASCVIGGDWGHKAYGCGGAHEAVLVAGRRITSVRSLIHAF